MSTHPTASEIIHGWYESESHKKDDPFHEPFRIPHSALRQLVHRVQDALDAAHEREDAAAAYDVLVKQIESLAQSFLPYSPPSKAQAVTYDAHSTIDWVRAHFDDLSAAEPVATNGHEEEQ